MIKLVAALSLAALVAGCSGVDPNSPAGKRHAAYEKVGAANKALGKVFEAPTPDLAAAAEPIATLKAQAAVLPSLFPAGSGPESGQKTEALPAIWSDPAGFSTAMNNFTGAVAKLDAAHAAGDLAATKAAAADLGKTCKACHTKYRKKD
ncbi:cytochrome c [Novosphingobium flavum]|uniref:Cytochrome c n=1 Tax=Novosphingobium flavum TaxID=1778672 RepID=A0A7X1KM37_9SPHN|nr:cytochrome c [Novosphingobium flavum]MBC2666224.1 cytochrome c [Novosphingobium flavum]